MGDKVESSGYFFTTYYAGKVASDFYMFKIACDEGQEEFKIPMVASKSVVFLDLLIKCNKFGGKWGLAYLQWAHDFKLNSRTFRERHYKVKWLQLIDHTRFRTRFKFDLTAKEFFVGLNDPVDGYGDPYYKFIFPDCRFTFDGSTYDLSSSKMLLNLNTETGYKTFATFDSLHNIIEWKTHNDKMPKNQKRPIFIPIDSSRMSDPDYDPWEQWRTVSWSLQVETRMSDRSSVIDLDQLQDLLNRTSNTRLTIEKFLKPPLFIWRFKPWPVYGYLDLNMKMPPLLLTMFQGALSINIGGDITINYNNSLKESLNVTADSLDIKGKYNMRNFFNFIFSGLQLKQNSGVISVNISKIDSDIALDIAFQFKDLPIKLHRKKVAKQLIPIQNIEDLYHHFSKTLSTVAINKFNIRLIKSNELLPIFTLNTKCLIIETRSDDKNIVMNTFTFLEMSLLSSSNIQLITVRDPQLCMAFATNRKIVACTVSGIDLTVSQEELDLLVPLFKRFFGQKKIPDDEEDSNNGNQVIKSEWWMMFLLQEFNVKLLKQSRDNLITAGFSTISLEVKRYNDLREDMKININRIEIENTDAQDAFHSIFKCSESNDQPIFDFQLNQTRPLMRCPVFDRIEITMAPFIVGIDIEFFIKVSDFFKSTDEMHVLDFDEEDLDQIQANTEIVPDVNTAKEDSNLFFCRLFRFNPIDAGLNIRFPKDGMFGEFLNRPFQFNGLNMEDIFGTKQQIIALLKKNLKWTALKALPKFLFKKNKE